MRLVSKSSDSVLSLCENNNINGICLAQMETHDKEKQTFNNSICNKICYHHQS